MSRLITEITSIKVIPADMPTARIAATRGDGGSGEEVLFEVPAADILCYRSLRQRALEVTGLLLDLYPGAGDDCGADWEGTLEELFA